VESEAVDSKKKNPRRLISGQRMSIFFFQKKIASKKDSMKRVAERIENAD